MYQKTTWFHTNEFKRQTQCPITGEIYALCPHSMGGCTCGFRAQAESKEERLEQIRKHLSGKNYCSILYLRQGGFGPSRIYTDWVIEHYQPDNPFQSPINIGKLKPEWIQSDSRLQKVLSKKTEIQIPHLVQQVVACLIWERTGKKSGNDSLNWKEAEKIIQKFWFCRRDKQLERELKNYGPVWSKINLMATYAVRDMNPQYQQLKKQSLINSYQFYQGQLHRIRQEM